MPVRALLAVAATAALLALPAPASAWFLTTDYEVAIAVGEGRTVCKASDHVTDWPFSDRWDWYATTDCDVAVEMFTEAWWYGDVGEWSEWNQGSGPCSGVRTLCELGGGDQGEFHGGSIRHHVKLRAPLGQGWAAAPDECSGVGTDNLNCWFDD